MAKNLLKLCLERGHGCEAEIVKLRFAHFTGDLKACDGIG